MTVGLVVIDGPRGLAEQRGGQWLDWQGDGWHRGPGLEEEGKNRTLSWNAVHPDVAAHQLAQPPADGEAETSAAILAGG